jgi:hypothetical protein
MDYAVAVVQNSLTGRAVEDRYFKLIFVFFFMAHPPQSLIYTTSKGQAVAKGGR